MKRAGRMMALAVASVSLVAVAWLVSAPPQASAQAPTASATATATTSPTATATTSPTATATTSPTATASASPTALPALASRAFPLEKSEAPSNDAWQKAEAVAPTRTSRRARTCTLHVVREWARVTCPLTTAALLQYAGSTEDVRLWVTPKSNEGSSSVWGPPFGGHVTFPLRRGAGYLFQFHEVESGYDDFSVVPGVLVDVGWPESQAVPTVVLR